MNMDSLQFWIGLIIVIITLISRASKKKTQTFDSGPSDSPDFPSETTKPISFEDLLREIQASKAPQTTHKPTQPAAPKIPQFQGVDYDDEIEDDIKPVEKSDFSYKDDKIYETYEKAKKEAFARPSLEETLKVEDTKVTYAQFKPYGKLENKSLSAKYADELKNPTGFKRALILSEILKKRF